MTLKDLYEVISPFESVQLMDAMTGDCITAVDYIADSGNEIRDYFDNTVHGIASAMGENGDAYIRIMLDRKL